MTLYQATTLGRLLARRKIPYAITLVTLEPRVEYDVFIRPTAPLDLGELATHLHGWGWRLTFDPTHEAGFLFAPSRHVLPWREEEERDPVRAQEEVPLSSFTFYSQTGTGGWR